MESSDRVSGTLPRLQVHSRYRLTGHQGCSSLSAESSCIKDPAFPHVRLLVRPDWHTLAKLLK